MRHTAYSGGSTTGGLLTSLDQYTDDPTVEPETKVLRSWDGYGQMLSETVTTNSTTVRQVNQSWDGAGRRGSMVLGAQGGTGSFTLGYNYRADGLMTNVMAGGQNYGFAYDDNGLLASRSNPWRSLTVNQRDGRGRATEITTAVAGATAMVETMDWRANSTLNDCTAVRSDFTDTRNYAYNNRGQLTRESFDKAGSAPVTNTYSFDGSLLGVLTSSVESGSLTNQWASGPLDGLFRVQIGTNTVGLLGVHATGISVGAASVNVSLDGGTATYASYNPGSSDGMWSADLTLSPGSHTLKATANHPLGAYHPSVTNSFSAVGTTGITNYYDGAGNVISRVFTNHTQALTWDAAGRLIRIMDTTGTATNYGWTAWYDGLGRRLETVNTPVVNGTNAPGLTLDSWYDPQVEFQEMAVGINGQRTFKVHGPDVSGAFGGSQGIGGLEATIRESDGLTIGLLNDRAGNGLATIRGAALAWSSTRLSGYGPELGFKAPPLSLSISLAEVSLWHGLRIDSPGYYYSGARYYNADEGRFISADPLGHTVSMDLYSYCQGDPINGLDADGRCIEGITQGSQFGSVPATAGWTYQVGYSLGILNTVSGALDGLQEE